MWILVGVWIFEFIVVSRFIFAIYIEKWYLIIVSIA